MDLRYIKNFVVTCECGSIAEASRSLNLAPAAVAARIRALEKELGTSLVKRVGRTVKPTADGLAIFETAKAMLREERDLRALANGVAYQGELRIGTFVSALTTILPPVLRSMYDDSPDLAVSVVSNSSTELCRMVTAGDLDAAIVIKLPFAMSKTCDWRTLFSEPMVVVVPEALENEDPLDLLRTQPYIQYDRSVVGGELAERYLLQRGIEPRRRLEINGVMSIAAMVDQGIGISLLPDWSALWDSRMKISKVSLPATAPQRITGIVWAPRSPHAFMAQKFLEHSEAIWCQTK